MTFTSTTIRKLRALGLDQETFDAVLTIFEDAKESKLRRKGGPADRRERGTRLQPDWQLPAEWRERSAAMGLHHLEINREAVKFKNYWLNATGDKGIKLRWDLTWDNWSLGALERLGRAPRAVGASAPEPVGGPESFTPATWAAIGRRFKSSGQWSSDWGPAPGRMDCQMPVEFL